jgi:hypothetical protein
MGCCALGTCTDPTCDICTRVRALPQPMTGLERMAKYAEPATVVKRPDRDPSKIKRKRKPIAAALWQTR